MKIAAVWGANPVFNIGQKKSKLIWFGIREMKKIYKIHSLDERKLHIFALTKRKLRIFAFSFGKKTRTHA